MSMFGPATPASIQPVSGVSPADLKVRGGAKQAGGKPVIREHDEVDVSGAMSSDAVRNLKSNGEEETAEDREKQDHYKPQKKAPPTRPPLDVQG
jgi:hypothetical protein